ncbi:MAG: ABC transporter permease [Mycobacteriaceae bacterium]
MSVTRTWATARRVLTQLRHDPRTIALLLVMPCVLQSLLWGVLGQNAFNRAGPLLLGLFPFTTLFVVTSVATLRERTSGTLERLLTTPLAKVELLGGYGIAFALAGVVQALAVCGLTFGPLGLHVAGNPAVLVALVVLDALLGMALGLFVSAFATTEFQAVQFLPAVVLPQVLLCGLLAPRAGMADGLRWLSNVMPLSYATDALNRVAQSATWNADLVGDMVVVVGVVLLALVLGALTLRRQTA